jgi:hypothetical protein
VRREQKVQVTQSQMLLIQWQRKWLVGYCKYVFECVTFLAAGLIDPSMNAALMSYGIQPGAYGLQSVLQQQQLQQQQQQQQQLALIQQLAAVNPQYLAVSHLSKYDYM